MSANPVGSRGVVCQTATKPRQKCVQRRSFGAKPRAFSESFGGFAPETVKSPARSRPGEAQNPLGFAGNGTRPRVCVQKTARCKTLKMPRKRLLPGSTGDALCFRRKSRCHCIHVRT